jgi:Electron transfer DM13
MKIQTSLLMALTSLITVNTVVLSTGIFHKTHAEQVSFPSMVANATFSPVKVLASGNFVDSEHPTKGLAEVVTQNGKNYLRLNKAFKSDEGPDVFVLLHREDSPKKYKKSDYVSLGRLQKIRGKQLYRIPQQVNVSEFKSVVIWCRQFNATFGFAPLTETSAQ